MTPPHSSAECGATNCRRCERQVFRENQPMAAICATDRHGRRQPQGFHLRHADRNLRRRESPSAARSRSGGRLISRNHVLLNVSGQLTGFEHTRRLRIGQRSNAAHERPWVIDLFAGQAPRPGLANDAPRAPSGCVSGQRCSHRSRSERSDQAGLQFLPDR